MLRKKYQRSEEGEKRRIESVRKAICGKKQTQEHKDKIVTTRRKNNSYIAWNKGRKGETNNGSFKKGHYVPKEWIIKANRIKKGKHYSVETEFKKGHTPWCKGTKGLKIGTPKGTKFTEDHKKNMSLVRKGKPTWSKGKTGLWGANKGSFKKGVSYPWSFKSGEKHPNWMGGTSFEPYGIEFDKTLRNKIRKRDNYNCQECGILRDSLKRDLDIHHIDYNKQNNSSLNLISLCRRCHAKTNSNRKHWKRYFHNIMALREIFNPENVLIFDEKTKGLIEVLR